MIAQPITHVRVVSPWRQIKQIGAVTLYNAIYGVGWLIGGRHIFTSSTNTFSLIISIFIIIVGAILLIPFFIEIISPIAIHLLDKHLLSTGECVDATITDVLQSPDDLAYFVVCEWTDRNFGNISCTSSLFLDNPVEILNKYNINTFPVYFHARNPKRCVMDTSSIE